jgi:aspartokinase
VLAFGEALSSLLLAEVLNERGMSAGLSMLVVALSLMMNLVVLHR